MIIVGYQGIGKSTTAENGNGYIDLESSNFFVEGKRSDDWYIPYCQIAMHLSEQGYKVFVSSHKCVREYLRSMPKKVPTEMLIIAPSLELKQEWLLRLAERYERTNSEKDCKALQNAVWNYEENILDLENEEGFTKIRLYTPYDLATIIEAYEGSMKSKENTDD